MVTKKEDVFIVGGLLCVLGLYTIAQGGFVLLGFGLVMIASTSEERTQELFEFFLSAFEDVWHFISNL